MHKNDILASRITFIQCLYELFEKKLQQTFNELQIRHLSNFQLFMTINYLEKDRDFEANNSNKSAKMQYTSLTFI